MKRSIRKGFRTLCIFTVVTLMVFLNVPIPAVAGDLPSGPDVKEGNPSITVDGNEMTVDAGQFDKTWIDWMGGFNIGAENAVNNIGPSSAAAILHNDISGAISNIQGMLNGNCRVFILNPNGILFSPTAQINVGALVASTFSMSQEDFMNDNYALEAVDASAIGTIINQGSITAFDKAGVTLAAGAVRNTGTIDAHLGTVNMLSGSAVTLNISGDGSIQAAVSEAVLDNVYDQDGNKVEVGVENLGEITADGGDVYIETEAVGDVFETLVNQEGVIRAGSMVERDGKIVLVSDSEGIVQNTGTLDVSAIEDGADGGTIKMLGENVRLFGEAELDASGSASGGTINVGGNYQGKGPDRNSELTVVGKDVEIKADAGTNGDGGEVVIWSNDSTYYVGNISAKGGSESGDGGSVEVSGKQNLNFNGYVNTTAANGQTGMLLLDPDNIIIHDVADGGQAQDSGGYLPTTVGSNDAGSDYHFGEVAMESQSSNITLEATNDITINDLADNVLDINNGGSFNLTITADSNGDNLGLFTMNSTDTIDVTGNITISGGDGVTTGGLNSNGGNINLDAGAATLDINNSISTGGGSFTAAGVNIDLADVDDIINAGAGDVSLTASANIVTVAGANCEINSSGTVTLTGDAIGASTTLDIDNTTALVINDTGSGAIAVDEIDTATIAATTITVGNTGYGTIDISYINGDSVDINDSHDLNAVDLDQGVSSFSYTATAGNVSVTSVDTGTNDTTITAAGNITTGSSGSITADVLTLVTTGSGSTIGTVSGTSPLSTIPLYFDATTIAATSNQGHIILQDTAGGIAVDSITTSHTKDATDATRIILTAVGGAITDYGNDTTADINAWAANLVTSEHTDGTHGGAIGGTGAAAAIDTDVSVLNATADDGGIYINQPDDTGVDVDIILGDITAKSEGRTPYKNDDGYVVVATEGTTTSDFDIEITAGGDVFISGVITSPDALTITAEDSMSDSHDGTDFVAANLTLTAGGGGSIGIGQSANPMEMQVETIDATCTNFGIYLSENMGTTIGTILSSGSSNDVEVTASTGDLAVGDITAASATVTLESSYGAITDNNGGTVNITAADAILTGKTGIGTTGAYIDTQVGTISATSDTADAGPIYINETDALTSITVSTNNGDVGIDYVNSGAKTLAFDSSNDLSLSDSGLTTLSFSNTGGPIDSNGIAINTSTGVITLDASTAITQAGGSIAAATGNLTAGTAIGVSGTEISTSLDTLTASASDGGVYISEADAIEVTATAAGTAKDIVIQNASDNMTINAITATQAVNLTAAASLIDGNGSTSNISGTETTLVAGSGSVGTSGDVLESTVAGTIDATSATGVFITNTGNVTQLDASSSGVGNITFTNTGSIALGAVTAAGDTVSLTATTDITDASDDDGAPVIDITADTLNVDSRSFGSSTRSIETDVSTFNSIVTGAGGIYIDDRSGDVTITTITAGGASADVEFLSAGNITLGAVTATGDDVLISTSGGNITDGNGDTNNVTANTLEINATGTIGSGDSLELVVNQIDSNADGGIAAVNTGPISITSDSLQGNTTAVTIVADNITILDDTADDTITMGAGSSLTLTANYGNIVFLDEDDTISSAGNITFTASYNGTPPSESVDNVIPGHIVTGNLTSTGGNISLTAYSDITVSCLTASSGSVTVTSTNGLVLDGNGATANVVANSATLSGVMHTSEEVALERENIIAQYYAAVAETDAKESLMNTWESDYNDLDDLATDAQAVQTAAQATYDAASADYDSESATLDTYDTAMTVLVAVRTAAQIAKDIASFPSSGAQAVPLTGDGGADTVGAAVDLAFSIADAAMLAYELSTLNPQEDVVSDAQHTLSVATANLESATNDYNNAAASAAAANSCFNMSTADYDAAVIERDHAEQLRDQAIASYNAVDAVNLDVEAATVEINSTDTTSAGSAGDLALTGATDVTLNTTGDIGITNAATANATLNLVTSNGDITYTQTGDYDILVDTVTADTTDDTVTLTSAKGIYDSDAANDTVDITAAIIVLTAGSDGIGQTNGSLDVNATSSLSVTISGAGNADVTIDDHVGDLPIGSITAGTGTVTLDSVNGAIDDAASDTTADITADTVVLNAASGIGSSAAIELASATSITGATTAGSIDIDNVADAPVSTLSLQTAAGNIDYGQTGLQTLDVDLAQVTNGDITITNNAAVNIVDINGDTTDGVVTLTATGGALTSTDSSNAVLSYTLTIGSAATVGSDAGSNVVGAGWFDVDITNLNITTAGATYIDENDDINLLDVTTTGEFGVDAADSLTITQVSSASQDVFLTTTADILDGGETNTDVTSSNLRMTAGTGVSDGAGLETAISVLAVTTASGDIIVHNDGALSVGTIDAVNGATITAGGVGDNIIITTASPLTVDVAVVDTGGGDITLAAYGATSTDDLTINANVTATGGAGNIYLYAGDSIAQSAGTVISAVSTGDIKLYAGEDWTDSTVDADGTSTGTITMNDTGRITASTGVLSLIAPGDITLGGLTTSNTGSSAVTLTSTAGAIVDGGDTYTDITADSGSAITTIDAVTGVGSANALETSVATIDIDNDPDTGTFATGNIQIAEQDTAAGGLIIQKAVQGDVGVEATNTGNINISTVDGAINITGAVTSRDGGTITIDANDASDDEAFSLTVGAAVTSSVGLKDVGVDVVTAGAIALSADDDVDLNAKVSTYNANPPYTANGNISVTADNGDVLVGAEVETVGTGDIIITAGQNVTFDAAGGLLDASETTEGADVTVTATAGNITESVDNTDLDIQGNTINLNATTGDAYIRGHAAGEDLEIDSVLAVNADTSGGSGEITLSETTGNMLVDLIDAGTGTVNLTAASAIEEEATGDVAADIVGATLNLVATSGGIGALAAIEIDSTTSVNANSSAAGGDINLSETSGNMLVGLINAGTGNVTLAAASAIEEDASADAAADIVGATIDLTATSGGIGAAAALELNATTLLNADASAANGAINIVDTAGGMPVGLITAGTNSVTLTATSGAITDGSLDSAVDIVGSAGTLTIGGATTIGSSATNGQLDTTVASLDLGNSVVSSDVYILETDALTLVQAIIGGLLDIETTAGILTIAGDVTVTGSNTISLNANSSNLLIAQTSDDTITSSTGNITLAGADILFGDAADANTALVTSTSGNIKITGSGAVTMNADAATRIVTTNGTITIDPTDVTIDGLGTTAGGAVSITASNNIAILDTATVTSTGAGVTITADDDDSGAGAFTMANGTTVIANTAGTKIDIEGASIVVDTITGSGASNEIELTAKTTTITSVDAEDDIADLTADIVDLDAVTGIGTSSASIDLASAVTITADTTTGVINLDNAADAAVTVSSMMTLDGDINYDQRGAYGLALGTVFADTVNDTVTITAQGDINPSASNDAAEVTAAYIDLTTTANGIGGNPNGPLDVNATMQLDADTTADDSVIKIDDIIGYLPIGVIDADSGAVTLTSVGGVTDADAGTGLDIGGGTVTIDAVDGVGSSNPLETEATILDIDNNPASGADATGNIRIVELASGGDLILQKASQGNVGVEATNSGYIEVKTQSGTLTVSGTVIARDGGTIVLDAEDSAGGDEDVIINATVTSSVGLKDVGVGTITAGAITITADHDIDVNGKVSTVNVNTEYTGNGDISLITDAGQNGDVKIGAEIESLGTGSIIVTADTDVDFDAAGGLLDTTETSSTLADATVTARNGNILESVNDQASPDLDIQARTITLSAENGSIGQGAGADIDIDSVVSVSADTSTGGGNINLNEMTGDFPIALIDAGTGNVTLTGASGITDADTDSAVDIIGTALYLEAAGSVGADGSNQELDTQVTTIDDRSGTENVAGSIYIIEYDGVTLGSINGLTTDSGAIDITAANTAAGDMTATLVTAGGDNDILLTTLDGGSDTNDIAVGVVTATDNTVSLVSDANITDADSANTNIIADALYLQSGLAVGTLADYLDTRVTTIDDYAGGNIGTDLYINEYDGVTLGSLNATTGLSTTDGEIRVIAAANSLGTLTASVLTAGGAGNDIYLTTADGTGADNSIGIGLVTAADDSVWLDSDYDITDADADTAVDIVTSVLYLDALGSAGATGNNGELDTTVDTIDDYSATRNVTGNIYVIETDAVSLGNTNGLTTDTGIIGVTAAGTITTGTLTSGGNAVNLHATDGNILDTVGGVITADATSSFRASGIIGTADNPVDVVIDGDLWVGADSQQNQISAILKGDVNSTSHTERVEIYEPAPPGLVIFNNALMGGSTYGSGSEPASILSNGYGNSQALVREVTGARDMHNIQPWAYQSGSSPWISFAMPVIDDSFLEGPAAVVDASAVGIAQLPGVLQVPDWQSPPNRYYVIKSKKK